MLAYERQRRIKQILYEKQTVDVSHLSQIFNVSETTVRRDLDVLEKQGFLEKTYGGAILKEIDMPQTIQDDILQQTRNEINQAVEIAIHLIKDGDAIFLTGGAICEKLAEKLITFSRLIVVTNDIRIANTLVNFVNVQLIVVGGQVTAGITQTVGEIAEYALDHIFISKTFLNVDGVDLNYGYTCSTLELSNFYKKLLNISKTVIVLAEAEKFGTISLARICDLSEANMIVTNHTIDDTYKSYFFSSKVKLYTTFDIT